MRVVILNPGPGTHFWEIFDVSHRSEFMPAPFFFGRYIRPLEVLKKYFFPGGPPHQHITLCISQFWLYLRDFQSRGFWEKKLERQGKGAQNVWNEPINAPLNPWVPVIARSAENRFSKLNILKKHPYSTLFSLATEIGVK